MANKAPIDMTEDEILAQLRTGVEHITYMREDWLRELDRREAKRQATAQRRTAYIATGAAIVSAVSALVALILRQNPT
jgi:hypothetical protein